MKKTWLAIILGAMLILTACGSADKQDKKNDTSEQEVGFSLTGDSIEEAENIPAEEKAQILEVFGAYIDTLNEQDIEGYLATLSEESYDIKEEREIVAGQLEEYDLKREVTNITIVKYDEAEAQVYANLKTKYKQLASGLETNPTGRQVTLLAKEEGKWKVAAVHFIGDTEKE